MKEETKLTKKRSRGKEANVGMTIIIVIAVISNQLPALMASLVCTMGISLVVYVPVSIIIGKLYFHLLDKFLDEEPADKVIGDNKEVIPITNNVQKAIVDYIEQARLSGMNDGQIGDSLKSQGGWSDDEIIEAFKSVLK
jgi:hypothetical protein